MCFYFARRLAKDAPMPSSSPLPSAGLAEQSRASAIELLENGNGHQKVEEDDSSTHNDGSDDDVIVEKIEVNGKEETPPKNKKTRRGKRKPKSSKSSGEQVSASASKRFLRCGCLCV